MSIKDIFEWALSLNLFPLWSQSDPINGELKPHVYGKRQTADSSWEFLKIWIEHEQIKTPLNNSYG